MKSRIIIWFNSDIKLSPTEAMKFTEEAQKFAKKSNLEIDYFALENNEEKENIGT